MSETAEQGTTYAVVGYVSDEHAKAQGAEGPGKALEVHIERGNDREIVRIPADAISTTKDLVRHS